MAQFYTFLAVVVILGLTGCDKDDVAPRGGKAVPLNSKSGWTAELIETLIACQPNPSTTCDCIIPKVTAKYTPEQVKEKSPYVASDMLIIKGQCEHHDSPVSSSAPVPHIPPNPNEAFSYDSINGGNCETGKHGFKTVEELCEGIQSEKLNNGCALKIRQDYFTKIYNCPGVFQKKP